jgi:hypothetical protein
MTTAGRIRNFGCYGAREDGGNQGQTQPGIQGGSADSGRDKPTREGRLKGE